MWETLECDKRKRALCNLKNLQSQFLGENEAKNIFESMQVWDFLYSGGIWDQTISLHALGKVLLSLIYKQ